MYVLKRLQCATLWMEIHTYIYHDFFLILKALCNCKRISFWQLFEYIQGSILPKTIFKAVYCLSLLYRHNLIFGLSYYINTRLLGRFAPIFYLKLWTCSFCLHFKTKKKISRIFKNLIFFTNFKTFKTHFFNFYYS